MTVGIDCRLAGLKHAGIGRYIENLILNLVDLNSDFKWVLFFYDQQQAQEVLKAKINSPNIKIVLTPINHYSLVEQAELPKIFTNENLDLLHVPHFNAPLFYKGNFVLTIHDLLWHEQKGNYVTTLNKWVYWIKYLGYKIITYAAIKRAQKIFVPSQTIQNTLEKYYPKSHHKIIITKEGIADHFKRTNTKRNLNSKQIVYTGSLYPHKNIQIVINALKSLPNYKLIIIGSRSVFQNKTRQLIKKLNLEKQVSFPGYISDQELLNTYHNSLALVQPSLSEGFGLTGVEAMSSGLPVLASDIAIFREIYQDGALYFNPYSSKSFVKAIEDLTPTKQASLIKNGIEITKQYNWQKMTQQTIDVYKKILKNA